MLYPAELRAHSNEIIHLEPHFGKKNLLCSLNCSQNRFTSQNVSENIRSN